MSVAQTKSRPPKSTPSPSLKSQLKASIAEHKAPEPFQTACEAELGDRVIQAVTPIEDAFLVELRAVGVALFHLRNELEPEDATLVGWCSQVISRKADEIDRTTDAVRAAARTCWNAFHPKGGAE